MMPAWIEQHWALVVASVFALVVLMFVAYRVWSDSARGRLRAALGRLRVCRARASRRGRAVQKASDRLARLRAKAETTKPRLLREAEEALQNAESLLKIAGDQVLIAANRVREIIVEEFPPSKQAALRDRHLSETGDGGKPATRPDTAE